jgi:REP element-mobilizing transposase RayT
VIALGGGDDHVHLLVQLPSALSVSDLMRRVKGSSAHLATHTLAPATFFKWQPGYGSVSVSPRHLAQVSDYIARQREHHAAGTLVSLLEHTDRPTNHDRP